MRKHLILTDNIKYLILKTEKNMSANDIVNINGQNGVVISPNIETVVEEPVKMIDGQVRFYANDEFPEPHMK